MIYDKGGNALNFAYSKDGELISSAYDIDGLQIFSAQPISLRVMSYNCGQWYKGSGSGISTEGTNAVSHRTLLQSIMTAQNPDILCIQEYWDIIGSSAVKDLLTAYPYYREVNGRTGYWGHAVYSKYPISGFTTTSLGNNRYLDKLTVTVDGRKINVFNCHLDTSSNENAKVAQAKSVFDTVSTYRTFILCGDFNTVCKSVSDTEYSTIMAQFVNAGFHVGNCSSQHGFIDTYTDGSTAEGTWYPCDHIITSRDISINSVYTDTTKLTDGLSETIDHLPFVANVTVN